MPSFTQSLLRAVIGAGPSEIRDVASASQEPLGGGGGERW